MAGGEDGAALAARIAELETRVAFQEHALNELSDALAQTRLERLQAAVSLYKALGGGWSRPAA